MEHEQGERGADPAGRATAYVCGHLDDIRRQLELAGDTGPLDALLTALRDGGEVNGLLDALHEALQQGGDALGVYGNLRAGVPRTLGDFGGARPKGTLYLCPGRRCDRYAWSARSANPPVCGIDGGPLCAERL